MKHANHYRSFVFALLSFSFSHGLYAINSLEISAHDKDLFLKTSPVLVIKLDYTSYCLSPEYRKEQEEKERLIKEEFRAASELKKKEEAEKALKQKTSKKDMSTTQSSMNSLNHSLPVSKTNGFGRSGK